MVNVVDEYDDYVDGGCHYQGFTLSVHLNNHLPNVKWIIMLFLKTQLSETNISDKKLIKLPL